jgi:hypothetical protein
MVLSTRTWFVLWTACSIGTSTSVAQSPCGDLARPGFGWKFTSSEQGFAAFRDARREYTRYLSNPVIHFPDAGNGFVHLDTIVAVDGLAATSREAGIVLSQWRPQPVRFQLRRAQQTIELIVSATPICPLPSPVGQLSWLGVSLTCSYCNTVLLPSGGRRWRFQEQPVIAAVERGSAADVAGLRAGDVLVRVNNMDIGSESAFSVLDRTRPGVPVRLTVRRAGILLGIAVTPGTTERARQR